MTDNPLPRLERAACRDQSRNRRLPTYSQKTPAADPAQAGPAPVADLAEAVLRAVSQLAPDASQTQIVADAMLAVATVERGVVDEERAVIAAFLAAAGGDVPFPIEPAWDPGEARRRLPTRELRELLVSLCMAVAHVDGHASPHERALVDRFAADLEIPASRRAELLHGDAHLDHAEQVALVRRALDHIAHKTTDAGDRVHRQPVAQYRDPGRYEQERAALFSRAPLVLAASSALPRPGSYLTLDDHEVPLLLVRHTDGRVRAFYNVCRHRGARLVRQPCGSARGFACPYHAWAYDTAGATLDVPHAHGFPGLASEDTSLRPVAVLERHGLVWGRLDGDAPLTPEEVDAHLGRFAKEISGLRLADHAVHEQRESTHDINWKLVVEGFLEAYHLKATHRTTFYPVTFDNLALHDNDGPHARVIYPLRKITALSAVDPGGWTVRPVASFIYQLFPNVLIAVEPFHVAVIQVIPLGPERSRIRTTALVSPAARRLPDAIEADVAALREGLIEDFAIGEEIQRGLRTRANDVVVFGKFEHALARFHAAVDESIRAGAEDECPSGPAVRYRPTTGEETTPATA